MTPTRALALIALLAAGTGCSTTVVVPDGVFACAATEDCPDGFDCRADRCYRALDGSVAADAPADDGGRAPD